MSHVSGRIKGFRRSSISDIKQNTKNFEKADLSKHHKKELKSQKIASRVTNTTSNETPFNEIVRQAPENAADT